MPTVELDGVKVVASFLTQRSYRAAYCDFLLPVTRANQAAALAKFKRARELGKYSGLCVSGIADLAFLEEFPLLLYLEVLDQKRVDIRGLAHLSNLRGLRIESPAAGVDFGWFPELEVFVGDWHADNRNLSAARELRQLRAWHFNPRAANLSDLAHAKRLEWLTITQTNITDLAGVETLEDLRYLEIAYAPKLRSLDALAAAETGIRELSLDKAKSIEAYQPIAAIPSLRRLKLSDCAAMADLRWTRPLRKLDMFSFVGTNVEDGDLTPLLELASLQYAGTMDKKHYNIKFDKLNDMLRQRGTVNVGA
jgi:hypothetical protein